MNKVINEEIRWTRRRFLATSAIAAAAANLPFRSLGASATYTRYNVSSPEGVLMLNGYKTAIQALLALPPDNPLNWYRLTLIHTLDCPHGNWWFLPWHRGYIGYFEEIIRQHSGMSNFALPYWDWTTEPEIPATFFGSGNVLDPTSSFFIPTYDQFNTQFQAAISAFYAGLTAGQQQELDARGLSTADDLWTAISGGMFFNLANARCLTAAQPSFAAPPTACTNNCRNTPDAVSQPTIDAALAPIDFITFGSGIVPQHSDSGTQGVLESQPHNLVHNCVGGFMGDFMSPVDPVFYMHHSNIERLWLEWTAKQVSIGEPTLPTGYDLVKWSKEPFLFYVNTQGQTLSKVAGDFAEVGAFDYTYSPPPGSAVQATAAATRGETRAFSEAENVPAELLSAAAATKGPELLAEVQIDPKGSRKGKSWDVWVNLPDGAVPGDTSSPHHVATLAFFGSGHGHDHGPTTFLVPISQAVRELSTAGRLAADKGIELFVTANDEQARTGPPQPVKAKVTAH